MFACLCPGSRGSESDEAPPTAPTPAPKQQTAAAAPPAAVTVATAPAADSKPLSAAPSHNVSSLASLSRSRSEAKQSSLQCGVNDGIIWNCALSREANGDVSYAAVQANSLVEDFSQVVSAEYGTLIGVYDGHGGQHASRFIAENLPNNLQKYYSKSGGAMSARMVEDSIHETEFQLLRMVREAWKQRPPLASAGSCLLLGVVSEGQLVVASVGDSRAVMGSSRRMGFGMGYGMSARQLTKEHNANIESVRDEMKRRFPKDPNVVIMRGGAWRVRGIIQVTRSIGDFYLKYAEFQHPPLNDRFRVAEPLTEPVLSCEPAILVHRIQPGDQFVIFASDGLWEQVSNDEAVDIVNAYPRSGIARRLVKLAMIRGAKKRGLKFVDLKVLGPGRRRDVHDDITVVVLFFNKPGSKSTPAHKPDDLKVSTPSLRAFQDLPEQVAAVDGEEDNVEDYDFWR